jgi:hypothetical protein
MEGLVIVPLASVRVAGNWQALKGPLRICLTKSVFLRRCFDGLF